MDKKFTTKDFRAALRNGPYAWPGGYPLYFVTDDGEALSFAAARENYRTIVRSMRDDARDGWTVVGVDTNYEDAALFCAHSGERIESAYAEDDADSSDDDSGAIPDGWDCYEYQIAGHYLSALINGDESGFEDDDAAKFHTWLESTPDVNGHWDCDSDEGSERFARCDVSGLLASVVTVRLMFRKEEQE